MPTLRATLNGKTVDKPLTKIPVTLGRQPGLDFTIPAKGASREHLRIGRLKDGTWALQDLGSTNGTKVNGEKVDKARLNHGDTIEIGDCVIEFIDPPPEKKQKKEKKPIVLVSKKDRARGKKPPAEEKEKAPEKPAVRIDDEETLEGWLERVEEFDALLTGDDKRVLFGRYELQKRLSEGGMGVVFRARHTKQPLDVALKVLKSDRVDENGIARFKQEAWAISAFDHPNIVKVRDLAMHGGMHFIAMDYIDGEDLLSAGFKKSLTFWQVAEIVDKMADVLSMVHGRNIWHRDIKPQNLILDRRNEVKLIDFGIATVEREQDDATKTAEGLIMGTPAFLSPEQIARGKMGAVDGRADLYSLGGVMYYLLTGRRPFTGKSKLEILANNMKKKPPHPGEVDEHVPKGLAKIAMRLLEKQPADRYQTADELRGELARWRKSSDGKEELSRHRKIMKLRERKKRAKAAD